MNSVAMKELDYRNCDYYTNKLTKTNTNIDKLETPQPLHCGYAALKKQNSKNIINFVSNIKNNCRMWNISTIWTA
jgi:hypothetical protein